MAKQAGTRHALMCEFRSRDFIQPAHLVSGGCMRHAAGFHKAYFQRSSVLPNTAPTAAGNIIPSVYHVLTNATLLSVQYRQ